MRPIHGNDLKNEKLHHLYEIIDKETDDTFKYGISADPIDKDGLSKRIRWQLSLINNIVGIARFFAKILLRDIPGRSEAKQLEDEYIERYSQLNGHRPRGNPKRKSKYP